MALKKTFSTQYSSLYCQCSEYLGKLGFKNKEAHSVAAMFYESKHHWGTLEHCQDVFEGSSNFYTKINWIPICSLYWKKGSASVDPTLLLIITERMEIISVYNIT